MKLLQWIYSACLLLIVSSCQNENSANMSNKVIESEPSLSDVSNYWRQGKAEIASYDLKQARYGEIRKGSAVLVSVYEPFSQSEMVKVDQPKEEHVTVLKVNFEKKFNTGVYPYSMLTSVFYPIENNEYGSLKISTSSQEWCGHTYMEVRRKELLELDSYSYFQSEGVVHNKLDLVPREDDIWANIRINPQDLKTGNLKMIPSFFYLRLMHHTCQPYNVIATLDTTELVNYTLSYPTLNRLISIHFDKDFPHLIHGWEESYDSGFGEDVKRLTTTAKRKEVIQLDYWNRNHNSDLPYRDSLGLTCYM